MKFRHPAIICAATLGATSVPASADISALYEVESYEDEIDRAVDFAMTIEVSDEGHARLHLSGRSSYFLIREGAVYAVARGIDGPYAERLDDLEAVIENAGQAGGISLEILAQLPEIELVKSGTVKVGTWKGQGYAQRDYDDEIGRPELVVTEDGSLRPIGKAFAQLMEGRFGALRSLSLTGLFGGLGLYDQGVRDLLKGGTPIRIRHLELSEVSSQDIDPARFELPPRVLTRDEIRSQNEPFEWAPAFGRQPEG
ncbi:hypothetical protein GRI43_09705 [Altererythrobacter luteolus]|uniref:DUF4412 domain-containing protein n=1 Tax=Pontixanthobacter luteolus TaxID=295089 RepID=A0A6I4V5T1_9SPHN|nr:hypothetical protein [Pontixanthobacter luteolus]MXP47654.1 hypothetical protein [Pontixanthobacter luteolus]